MTATYKRKCALTLTVAALAVAIGCKGFFQNPTVTSVTVSPSTNNLQLDGTRQLTAIANNNDGSTKDVTGLAIWDTSDASAVSVSSTGLVKALQNTNSSTTITASYKGFSGSATVTVGGQTVTITCNNCTSGNTISISTSGGTIQLSSNVAANWSSSDSNVISITSGSNTTSPTATLGTTGQSTITATAASGNGSGTLQITVNP